MSGRYHPDARMMNWGVYGPPRTSGPLVPPPAFQLPPGGFVVDGLHPGGYLQLPPDTKVAEPLKPKGFQKGFKGGGGRLDVENFKSHFDSATLDYVNEDLRLSTLQRKLLRETHAKTALALAFQISAMITMGENKDYIQQRATDVILDSISEILNSGTQSSRSHPHGDKVKNESANAFGRVGAVLADRYYFLAFSFNTCVISVY